MLVVTLPAFTPQELTRAKRLLAGQVATMMGRKLEEGDWSRVYCRAKDIPELPWSNVHIDVNHNGLGVEMKLLRPSAVREGALQSVCGQRLMHPSATRSIRIDNLESPAQDVMEDVFRQYAALIAQRRATVRANAPDGVAVDMRTGWLIWERDLVEFLYFEEPTVVPRPEDLYAEWHETAARGMRKASRSLWVYDRENRQKRYSITTSAGIKIQPYFDVPAPDDENLYYFRVQSEPVGQNIVLLWVAASTAQKLKERLGALDLETVSAAILKRTRDGIAQEVMENGDDDLAVSIAVSREAHGRLMDILEGVSDEHRVQLLLKALPENSVNDEA